MANCQTRSDSAEHRENEIRRAGCPPSGPFFLEASLRVSGSCRFDLHLYLSLPTGTGLQQAQMRIDSHCLQAEGIGCAGVRLDAHRLTMRRNKQHAVGKLVAESYGQSLPGSGIGDACLEGPLGKLQVGQQIIELRIADRQTRRELLGQWSRP